MSSAAPEASAEPVAAPAPAADDPNQVEKVLLGGGGFQVLHGSTDMQ